MTYAIETPLGRFEADTERKAKALLRKAAKEHKRQEAEAADKRAHARLIAGDHAGRVLSFYVEQKLQTIGWRYYPAGHRFCPAKSEIVDCYHRRITMETQEGRIDHDVYRVSLVGAVMNGAGWCIVVYLRDDSNDVQAYTVGTVDGHYSMVRLPEQVEPAVFVCGRDE